MMDRRFFVLFVAMGSALFSYAALGRPPADAATAHQKVNAVATETFIVIWTSDYGYRLMPAGVDSGYIMPVFVGKGTEAAFARFFTPEAMRNYVGRKIYCRCTGERVEEDGETRFAILEARLYAQ